MLESDPGAIRGYASCVRALPEGLETSALVDSLTEGWGLDVEALLYAAVGGGGYHWVVHGPDGTRGFVTVDDLDKKPWLADTRESVFDGLRRAFDTAVALRDAGLGFVVAPIATRHGETVRRLGPRHTISLFPFVDGRAGTFGHHEPAERAAVISMLIELHGATPLIAPAARSAYPRCPVVAISKRGLCRQLDQTWSGGPFSEPARQTLTLHASDVAELLSLADRLSADVARRRSPWVVTHGEPHAANVMWTGQSHVLIDWDASVALGPPERDLWMVLGDAEDEAARYSESTGHQPDQVAIDFFRLVWDLNDLAAFINVLRSPHRHSEDTVMAYEGLKTRASSRDRWIALLG